MQPAQYKKQAKKKVYKKPQSLQKKVDYLYSQQLKIKGAELAQRNYIQYGMNTSVDTIGSQLQITNISTGTGLGSRKDLKIKLSSLEYKICVTAADTTNIVRVLIVQSKAALAGGTSDWIRNSSGGSGYAYSEPANVENAYILADHMVCVGSLPGVAQGKITNFPIDTVQYTSTTGTSGSVGMLYIIVYSDSTATTHPSAVGFTKLKYYD